VGGPCPPPNEGKKENVKFSPDEAKKWKKFPWRGQFYMMAPHEKSEFAGLNETVFAGLTVE
jgi:hypothetical protein